MSKPSIFVDESGTPDPNNKNYVSGHPIFLFGFVYCKDPNPLKFQLKRLLSKLHKKNRYPDKLHEIKFQPLKAIKKLGYSNHEIETKWKPHFDFIRVKTSNIVADYSDGIFCGLVDKRDIKESTWTGERLGNYLFRRTLINNMLSILDLDTQPQIIYDKGRLNSSKGLDFNGYIKGETSFSNFGMFDNREMVKNISDVDSVKIPQIWAADNVAGAFKIDETYNNDFFIKILRKKFIGTGIFRLWE